MRQRLLPFTLQTGKNLAVAKIRSNRVKSELITHADLKEFQFITRNHDGEGDRVTVSIYFPVTATTTIFPAIEEAAAFPAGKLPSLSAHLTGSLYGTPTAFPTLSAFAAMPSIASAPACSPDGLPRFAFKVNLLYLSALLLNAEAEYYLKGRWSLNLDLQYAWWSKRSKHKYYRIAAISPEIRYWFASCERFRGQFGGFYLGTGLYEFMFKPTHGIQGEFFIAGGLTYGYAFSLSEHLRMELSLGVGYMMTEYRQYHWDRGCYVYDKTQRYSYFGPTKAKVSLIWPLNLFRRKPERET